MGGRDFLLGQLVSIALAFALLGALLYTGRHLEGPDFLQAAAKLVGPFAARVIAAVLLVFVAVALLSTLRMGVGIFTFVYVQTPAIVLILAGLAVVAYALYGGLEVIARVGQLLMPQVMLVLLLGILLAAPNMRGENLFPLLEDGLRPVFASGAVQFAQWGEITSLVVLIPYVHNRHELPKHLARSLGAASLILLTIVGAVVSVLGALAPTTSFKLLEVYRYISIGRLVERVDILLLLMYYFVTFVKACVLFYVLLALFRQLFNLRTYRPFILPAAAIGAVLAVVTPLTIPRLLQHPIFMLPFNLFVPVAVAGTLLAGCLPKGRRSAPRPGTAP
ncbi:MAG: GerAB/ArcD/ProY family transporter [Bacillota bacterium]